MLTLIGAVVADRNKPVHGVMQVDAVISNNKVGVAAAFRTGDERGIAPGGRNPDQVFGRERHSGTWIFAVNPCHTADGHNAVLRF